MLMWWETGQVLDEKNGLYLLRNTDAGEEDG